MSPFYKDTSHFEFGSSLVAPFQLGDFCEDLSPNKVAFWGAGGQGFNMSFFLGGSMIQPTATRKTTIVCSERLPSKLSNCFKSFS